MKMTQPLYCMQYTFMLLKVRKKEMAGRDGQVFFLLLPRITSKAHPESLQFIHLLVHSSMLAFNKYCVVPASCQALFYVPEIQAEQGKQHPCLCNTPVSSSLEVKSPAVEVHCVRTSVSPAFAFA